MASRSLRLYITANGDQAVRTFTEVGDASSLSADKIDKSSIRSSAAMDEMHKSSRKLGSGVGLLAGTIGIGGLAFGIKDAIEAGQKWQIQQASLANALKNTGQYSKATAAVDHERRRGAVHEGRFRRT